MSADKNILVIRFSAMGDVAMAVPVISSVAAQYPDVNITVLSAARFADMFPETPNIHFIGIDLKKQKGIRGIYKIFKTLTRQQDFDAVIDLHDVLRSKVLCFLFKTKNIPVYIIKKGRKEKKRLTAQRNKKLVPLRNTIDRYFDVFREAGYKAPLVFRGLLDKKTPLPEEIGKTLGNKQGKWLGIAPFAQHNAKVLPLEITEAVIVHFSEQNRMQILLFGGGENEKKILDEWQKKYPNTFSVAGKYSLKNELRLLNQTDLLLSMDSANMHLAALVGTPVVTVWGATHPYAGFYGLNNNPENYIQRDLSCRPCSIYGNKPCFRGDYACLTQITSEEIIRKIEAVLFQ